MYSVAGARSVSVQENPEPAKMLFITDTVGGAAAAAD
jgi:hypothetical protein